MKEADAEKIVRIMMGADKGCSICASSLLISFYKAYPIHKDLCRKMFYARFKCGLGSEECGSLEAKKRKE